jgi:DNA-directed RNA polymerase subunit M
VAGPVPFCPNCKKLVYPVGGKLVCKNPACGWTSAGPAESNPVAMGAAEGRKRVVLEEKLEARPLQNVLCPKCGHGRAYFHLMQTRRSDEPPTQINECEKCHHSWRDYQ